MGGDDSNKTLKVRKMISEWAFFCERKKPVYTGKMRCANRFGLSNKCGAKYPYLFTVSRIGEKINNILRNLGFIEMLFD